MSLKRLNILVTPGSVKVTLADRIRYLHGTLSLTFLPIMRPTAGLFSGLASTISPQLTPVIVVYGYTVVNRFRKNFKNIFADIFRFSPFSFSVVFCGLRINRQVSGLWRQVSGNRIFSLGLPMIVASPPPIYK